MPDPAQLETPSPERASEAEFRTAVQAQFDARYGPAALMERYARARVRQLALRQVATGIGMVMVWFLAGAGPAVFCLLITLMGEFFEVWCLSRGARRFAAGGSLRQALRFSAMAAGVQSATIVSCVLVLLVTGQSHEASLVALCFLMAAAVNAGFVLTHHPLAAKVKLTVLASCVPVFVVVDSMMAGGFGQTQLLHVLEIAMLGYLTYTFTGFSVRSWRRRLANERALMDGAIRQEITNRDLRAAQADAEKAAQAKSAFLATMSHEIRTPLNAVIGMGDLLAQTNLTKEGRGHVEMILQASTSLLDIINDVLDFSRLDADQMTFEARPFVPGECIGAAVRMLMPLADKKGLELVLADDGTLPNRASADPGRLRQILINLIGNAIKFTDSGRVRVLSRAERVGSDWRLTVVVEDSGIGVRPDRADAIFEVFQQADAATTRRFGGTGLGLPISRALARRMGGDIRLLPADPDRPGARFELTVVLERAAAEVPARKTGLVSVEPQITAPLHVVLADDNDTNRLLVRQFLKRQPVTLYEAANGAEAVQLTREQAPDVVLMDMSMPEMDGLEATRLIRASLLHQPRIVALTANAFASDREACIAAGMDDFLTKPIRKSVLIEALAAAQPSQKGLSQPGNDAVSGPEPAEEHTPWTSPPESGTTSGKSTRSSGP